MTIWGDDEGITWETASDEVKEGFALVRLFWFQRMVQSGGPDGSELDAEVDREAKEAADWFGPRLAQAARNARPAIDPGPTFVDRDFRDEEGNPPS